MGGTLAPYALWDKIFSRGSCTWAAKEKSAVLMNEIDKVLLEGVVGFGRGCSLLRDRCLDGRNSDNFHSRERETYRVVVLDGVTAPCSSSSPGKFKLRLSMRKILLDN